MSWFRVMLSASGRSNAKGSAPVNRYWKEALKGTEWTHDRLETLADVTVHGIGLVFAIIALVVFAVMFAGSDMSGPYLGAVVFAASLVASLTMSLLYNAWPPSVTKWVLRQADHACIFLLIVGTYTPFLLSGLGNPYVDGVFAFLLIAGIGGIAVKLIWPGRWHGFFVGLYLAMGWSGIVVFLPLSAYLSWLTLSLIAAGGIIYSAGVYFHLHPTMRFRNAIWHVFVVSGSVLHFGAVVSQL